MGNAVPADSGAETAGAMAIGVGTASGAVFEGPVQAAIARLNTPSDAATAHRRSDDVSGSRLRSCMSGTPQVLYICSRNFRTPAKYYVSTGGIGFLDRSATDAPVPKSPT